MAGTKAKGGKKNRKLGRNQDACNQYKASGRQELNQKRRLRRHLREHRHHNDKQGMATFKKLGGSEDAIYT